MHSTTELANLIHKRWQILRQLRDLGQRQGELIESGDTATLLRLLGVKQQVLAGLQATERALAPYHADDPESRKWPTSGQREECAHEAALCQQLLQEVLDLERQHERRMLARRDLAASELRQLHVAEVAHNAYRANHVSTDHGRTTKQAPMLATNLTPLDLSSEAC